jgi:uncharacterized protein (TIGR02996 family)
VKVAFLDTILEEPDDDTTRLVYADWLEDRDDPRGEFIRLQCQLARIESAEERIPLARRERELLAVHDHRWRSELPSVKGVEWGEFRRGFVAAICAANCTTFLTQAERIFSLAPIEKLSFRRVSTETIQTLAGSPWLGRVRILDLAHRRIEDDAVAALVSSPYLTQLHILDLGFNQIGDVGAVALRRATTLPALRSLNVCRNPISDPRKQELRAHFGQRVNV